MRKVFAEKGAVSGKVRGAVVVQQSGRAIMRYRACWMPVNHEVESADTHGASGNFVLPKIMSKNF